MKEIDEIEFRSRVAANLMGWMEITTFCEQVHLAGLRHQIGPDGDIVAAHRHWQERQVLEHGRDFEHLTRELARRERCNGH